MHVIKSPIFSNLYSISNLLLREIIISESRKAPKDKAAEQSEDEVEGRRSTRTRATKNTDVAPPTRELTH